MLPYQTERESFSLAIFQAFSSQKVREIRRIFLQNHSELFDQLYGCNLQHHQGNLPDKKRRKKQTNIVKPAEQY